MFFKTSENAFRTTHGTACPLVQESQDHLSFRTENSVLIVDSLSDLKSGSRQGLDGCNGSHDITHLCWISEPALQRDNRKSHAILLLAGFDRATAVNQKHSACTFEITDLIRMMDDAHLVGFIVPDRERCLRSYHNKKVTVINNFVLLSVFQ